MASTTRALSSLCFESNSHCGNSWWSTLSKDQERWQGGELGEELPIARVQFTGQPVVMCSHNTFSFLNNSASKPLVRPGKVGVLSKVGLESYGHTEQSVGAQSSAKGIHKGRRGLNGVKY